MFSPSSNKFLFSLQHPLDLDIKKHFRDAGMNKQIVTLAKRQNTGAKLGEEPPYCLNWVLVNLKVSSPLESNLLTLCEAESSPKYHAGMARMAATIHR